MSMTFRKAVGRAAIPRDVAVRQARLLQATQVARFSAEATRDFLNNHHPELAGRPLDVALRSDNGLLLVEKLISLEAHRRGDPA